MIRILSILIFVIGLLWLSIGAIAYFSDDPAEAHRMKVQIFLKDVIPESTIDEWYSERYHNRILFSIASILVGSITIVASIGIWCKKNWARITWLIIVSFLVLAYWLLNELSVNIFVLDDWINTGLITIIGIISWIYFCKSKTRSMFDAKKNLM